MQAGIGQDCQRGVDVTAGLLKDLGLPPLQIMNVDTETNVEVARARAEKLISEGAQLLVGAFDSGQSTAIAQVAEQKGIPYVINIAAAPPITEQGYKFVFRNFPTGPMILRDAFLNQKEVFQIAGSAPKTAVMLHVNDTYRHGDQGRRRRDVPEVRHAVQDRREDRLRPGGARPLGRALQGQGDRRRGVDVVSRLNDAIMLTREMVKQRWTPMAVLSIGPGWYEDQYFKTLGKLSDGPISLVPWYDPNKKMTKLLKAALAKAYPGVGLNTNHVYTFEALLDACRRLQAGGFGRSEGAGRGDPQDQHHQQCQPRPRHHVQCQGPERQAEVFRDPEPRRQHGDVGSQGSCQRQAGMAAQALR